MSDATMTLPTADATMSSKPRDKRLPARLVLAAIALLLAGGGWYGYERVKGTAGIPMAAAGDFLPDYNAPRVGYDGRVRPPPPNPDGVTVLGNAVVARANGTTLRASTRPDGKWQVTVNRPGQGFDRQAVELVLQVRRRILEPRRPQADLKVTEAQLAALAAAVPESPPELAADAYARTVDLLGQLAKLPSTDAKAASLKAELQQIVATASKTDVTAIAKEYGDRVAKIRATLSAEQVQSLLDQRPAPKPTISPATKPAAK